jgi:hypothetical protein
MIQKTDRLTDRLLNFSVDYNLSYNELLRFINNYIPEDTEDDFYFYINDMYNECY